MFSLAYIFSIIVTVVVLVFAYRYINRIFTEKGIPDGMVKFSIAGFLALTIALIVGTSVDWVAEPQNIAVQLSQPQP